MRTAVPQRTVAGVYAPPPLLAQTPRSLSTISAPSSPVGRRDVTASRPHGQWRCQEIRGFAAKLRVDIVAFPRNWQTVYLRVSHVDGAVGARVSKEADQS